MSQPSSSQRYRRVPPALGVSLGSFVVSGLAAVLDLGGPLCRTEPPPEGYAEIRW